jgi:hypothetical protein
MDEALGQSAKPGLVLAGRLCWPAEFAMTCGVVVPVDEEVLLGVMFDSAGWSRSDDPERMLEDPRLASTLHRNALSAGAMERVRFADPAAAVQ